MSDEQIKHMVDRFLGWKLPADFNPDAGINFTPPQQTAPYWWPVGTNLFTATQAEAMIRYITEGLVTTPNSFDDATLFEKQVRNVFEHMSRQLPEIWHEVLFDQGAIELIVSDYLTHRNAEYKKLLEQKRTLVAVDLGSFDYIPVSAIKDLMKEDE